MRGRAWKFGDNINTDEIIPARYLSSSDPKELAKHCLEDADPEFAKKVNQGDFIIGGENFGCGSSREHAGMAIKACGVSAVIAKSFARIFYRNAINIGLPILESPKAVDKIKEGDKIEVKLAKGEIKIYRPDGSLKTTASTQPFPEFMQKIIKAGGLINYIKKTKR